MDIVALISTIQPIDFVVFFALFGMFILGFMQGTVRRLLGLAAVLLSLLLAAQIRAPLGDFLARNWTQYPREYNQMIAFGAVFVAFSIAATIVIQLFYKKVPLFSKYTVVDEILGGLLGIVQGGLILAAFFIITDPFFLTVGQKAVSVEFPFVRDIHNTFDGSVTSVIVRDRIVPVLLLVLGAAFPSDVRDVFEA
ncbi:MAG: CvpA family protein [Candidatus Limnocylindrales bacterium]